MFNKMTSTKVFLTTMTLCTWWAFARLDRTWFRHFWIRWIINIIYVRSSVWYNRKQAKKNIYVFTHAKKKQKNNVTLDSPIAKMNIEFCSPWYFSRWCQKKQYVYLINYPWTCILSYINIFCILYIGFQIMIK